MAMTNSESQWLARVLRTVGNVALIEPPNAVDSSANKDPAEQAFGCHASPDPTLKMTSKVIFGRKFGDYHTAPRYG
jgi:hypothetical protein